MSSKNNKPTNMVLYNKVKKEAKINLKFGHLHMPVDG